MPGSSPEQAIVGWGERSDAQRVCGMLEVSLLGFAPLTPTYALASARNQKILIQARLTYR